jgi:D-amino-acid dehydrogenase
MTQQSLHIVVIGAGVVGASSALRLAQAGHRVELLDPRGICGGTSYGNAGGVHIGAIQPFGVPGVLWSALKMLSDPQGPLLVDWRYLPRSLPWFARFLANSSTHQMAAGAAATAAINHTAVAAWRDAAARARVSDRLQDVGWLKVYDREQDFVHAGTERQLMQDNGFPFEVLDAAALHELEPALGAGLRYGMLQPGSLFIDNPGRVVRAIAEAAINAGASFHREEVRHIRPAHAACILTTNLREITADRIVVASGAWSKSLAAQLGLRVPLETERGYHVMLPTPARSVSRPIMYSRRRFVLCPMQEGMRVTACVEFAGLERGPDYRRIEQLLPFTSTVLPGLDTTIQSRWLGYRPSLPDGIPVIDTAAEGRVVLAFGHGHLGLTQGPATALAVQALIEGSQPPFPLEPYSARRFFRSEV